MGKDRSAEDTGSMEFIDAVVAANLDVLLSMEKTSIKKPIDILPQEDHLALKNFFTLVSEVRRNAKKTVASRPKSKEVRVLSDVVKYVAKI